MEHCKNIRVKDYNSLSSKSPDTPVGKTTKKWPFLLSFLIHCLIVLIFFVTTFEPKIIEDRISIDLRYIEPVVEPPQQQEPIQQVIEEVREPAEEIIEDIPIPEVIIPQ